MAGRAKAQAFAHRLVEFADAGAARAFLEERGVDLDEPNGAGWSVLMSVCACGRGDLAGFVLDRTANVGCETAANRSTALHLAAISPNPLVMQELLATEERREKLRKIANTPNINGDTPLMMACVAKNEEAARGLIDHLGAEVSYGNATGMSALHCAARLSGDAAVDAAVRDDLARRSLSIVDLLLARGAAINVTELAAGNSALHFATMSNNIGVVNRLLDEPSVDVAIENTAGLTSLELAKRGSVHPGIASRLQKKWESLKAEQENRSAAAEQELLALVNEEVKSDKSKSKAAKKSKRAGSARTATQKAPNQAEVTIEKVEEPLKASTTVIDSRDHSTVSATLDSSASASAIADDSSDWQSVSTKKNRRKVDTTLAKATNKPRTTQAKKSPPSETDVHKPNSSPAQRSKPVQSASVAKIPPPPIHSEGPPPAAWTGTPQVKKQELIPTRQPARRTEPTMHSYEQLNAEFQRAFPMAGELELGVETFLIGSSTADHALQPEYGLSISQVEVLQEAHWQAYHYLNEKKLDLARVLEAQRLEAQFKLQQEILHLE